MIQVICGQKGKGKTKYLLEKANDAIATSNGEIVYLDKSSKHMYELNNKIRLINIKDYPVNSYDGFIGFVSGLISGNHDIDNVFFDSFLKIAFLENADTQVLSKVIQDLDALGQDDINFVLSISLDESSLPDNVKEKVIVSC
ncbi:MAG: twitching motility protein PilT [Eubacterium sp.]